MREENVVINTFLHKKRLCVIVKTGIGYYCAYAQTKLNISYSDGDDYNISPQSIISCHGGVTYSGKLFGFKDVNFFGMDFAHSGDHMELVGHECIECKYRHCHKWNLEEVNEETKKLANEIINYERKYTKLLKIIENTKRRIKQIKKTKEVKA